MEKLKVLDLFSGIGGFSLGLERAGGFETVAFCEIEEFPRKVLKKHWPNVPIYEDVRNVTAEQLRADSISVDVITGGFPCQDISVAGKQAGIGDGTRSGLWSECARLLGEIRPRYAIFENVTALLSGERGDWFKRVLWDISQVGFDVEWHCIRASRIGLGHERDRVWIMAHPAGEGRSGLLHKFLRERESEAKKGASASLDSCGSFRERARGEGKGESPILARNDGIPNIVHRLKCAGNAVVPQIPELIGRAILQAEEAT